MAEKHPYSDARREQHPVSVKTWPTQVVKAPVKLPGKKKKKK